MVLLLTAETCQRKGEKQYATCHDKAERSITWPNSFDGNKHKFLVPSPGFRGGTADAFPNQIQTHLIHVLRILLG